MLATESSKGSNLHSSLSKNGYSTAQKATAGNNNLPVRETDSQRRFINEDTRSVRTERHYDRSQRSTSSQKSQNVDEKSVRSYSSNRGAPSPIKEPSERNYRFSKLSTSNISNPDNLVCDNCVNHNIHDQKLADLQRQRETDKEHAQRVAENLRQQLEDEKRRHLDKLRLYQDAADAQKTDIQKRREADKNAAEEEKAKIRAMMADNGDEQARQQRMERNRQNFADDLRAQLDQRAEQKFLKTQEALDLDSKNHNVLIDDGWKEPHRRALAEYHKNDLVNQISDQQRDKEDQKNQKKEEDFNYRRHLQHAVANDKDLRRDLENQKLKIFQDEIGNQIDEKNRQNQAERGIKDLEDANFKKKIAFDNEVYLDNANRKQHQVKEYLNKLGEQMNDAELQKQLEKDKAKQFGLTGLPLNEKHVKCYNCSKCRNAYPLKMLNKRKKI